jgi:glyoxylase-like metal-dependent hydrolase (beta-lactamase superfamily II)
MESWQIGSVTITRIAEQVGPSSLPAGQFLPALERRVLEQHRDWLVPTHYAPEQDRLITSIHSWLIRTGRQTILLDCCAGNHKNRPSNPRFHRLDTPWLQRLQAAGVEPEEIDIVLCTHLHTDHIGWNTRLVDGRWVPTFPNARYLFSRIEHEHWKPTVGGDSDPTRRIAYEDSVLPVVAAGQADLIDGTHAIEDRLLVEPAPGHTPGHVVLKLANQALFCGDVIHHPIQLYRPEWNSAFCEDADAARRTRRRVLDHCAEARALLFPTHFADPFVAGIRAKAGAYAPDFAAGAAAMRRLSS